jgi:hypothetical protein
MVMAEAVGSRVSDTPRLSILKPLPLKRPAIRARTPNSFSTKRVITCRIIPKLHVRGWRSISFEEHFV